MIREGHDALSAEVVLVAPDGTRRRPVRMRRDPANAPDGWIAEVRLDEEGAWGFEVHGWSDPFGTWEHDAEIKVGAGIDVELMFTEGQLLLQRWIDEHFAEAWPLLVLCLRLPAEADRFCAELALLRNGLPDAAVDAVVEGNDGGRSAERIAVARRNTWDQRVDQIETNLARLTGES